MMTKKLPTQDICQPTPSIAVKNWACYDSVIDQTVVTRAAHRTHSIFLLIYSLPNSYNHRNYINYLTNIQREKIWLTHCSFARFLMNYFFFFDFMAGSTNIKVHYRHLLYWSVDQS